MDHGSIEDKISRSLAGSCHVTCCAEGCESAPLDKRPKGLGQNDATREADAHEEEEEEARRFSACSFAQS